MNNDIEKCTTYRRSGDVCTITCKLGLWSVSGRYSLALMNEADYYFKQYLEDGEYSSILGGDSVTNKLMKKDD